MMEYSPESVMREEGYPKSFGFPELECLGVGGTSGPDFRGSKSGCRHMDPYSLSAWVIVAQSASCVLLSLA